MLCFVFLLEAKSPPIFFFFFNDTATTEIYTLSLHDALPICGADDLLDDDLGLRYETMCDPRRSEEHTSELQSLAYLVCRLLLEKKKTINQGIGHIRNNKCKPLAPPLLRQHRRPADAGRRAAPSWISGHGIPLLVFFF